MQGRIKRLQNKLRGERIDALLIMRPENRLYLTGFTGTTGVAVVTFDEIFFLTDFRYTEQARDQCKHCRVVEIKRSANETLTEFLPRLGVKRLGCEGDFISYQQFNILREKLGTIELMPIYGMVEDLRQTKDGSEIDTVARAVELADNAFARILSFLRPGIAERDVALELEFFMRKNGAEKSAFEIIVASGKRGAMPHGVASEKRLQLGDMVTMDFGCVFNGYHSDITRTVVLGNPTRKQQEIYNIVLEAQLAGVKAVRAGVKACDVDRASRSIIQRYGYGDNFGHSTGHGLGLAIHENPRLAVNVDTVLVPGMVVTVEPGIYLPGWGGVRIEDSVVVEERGCRVLTRAPKMELINCC